MIGDCGAHKATDKINHEIYILNPSCIVIFVVNEIISHLSENEQKLKKKYSEEVEVTCTSLMNSSSDSPDIS